MKKFMNFPIFSSKCLLGLDLPSLSFYCLQLKFLFVMMLKLLCCNKLTIKIP